MSGAPRPPAALHYFATDQSLPVADFAQAAEHTHIPVGTESPYPGAALAAL